jgi:hypothetical protein
MIAVKPLFTVSEGTEKKTMKGGKMTAAGKN